MRRLGSRRRLRLGAQAATLCALTLTLAGCFGSSSSSSSSSPSGPGADADPASALPASTLLYVQAFVRPTGSIAAGIDAASQRLLGFADPGAKLDALIDKSANHGISYERTIQPWLGRQGAVALLGGSTTTSPQYAVVLDQTNAAKATAALHNPAMFSNTSGGSASQAVTTWAYRGVHYFGTATVTMVAGLVGHFLVIGTLPAFKAIVDVNKGAPSLASSSEYTQVIGSELPGSAGVLFAPYGKLFSLLLSSSSTLSPAVRAEYASLLAKYANSAIVASARINAGSIALDFAVTNAPAATPTGEANPIGSLPAGSWLAVGVTNVGPELDKVLSELAALGNTAGSAGIGSGATAASPFSSLSKAFSEIRRTTGIDVESDLGSITTAGLFAKGTTLATLEAGLVLNLKTPAKAPTIVNQLREFAGLASLSNKSFTVGRIDQAGIDAGFTIKLSGSPFTVDVAASGGRIVVALGPTSLSDALASSDRLSATSTYTGAASLLGSDVQPDLIVDLPQVATLLKNLGAASTPSAANVIAYLHRLGTVALGTGHTGTTDHERIVLGIG